MPSDFVGRMLSGKMSGSDCSTRLAATAQAGTRKTDAGRAGARDYRPTLTSSALFWRRGLVQLGGNRAPIPQALKRLDYLLAIDLALYHILYFGKAAAQMVEPTMAEEPRKLALSESRVSGPPVHRTDGLALRIV